MHKKKSYIFITVCQRISILKPNSRLTPSLTTPMCCLMCSSLVKKKIPISNQAGKTDWEWGQRMNFINDCCLVLYTYLSSHSEKFFLTQSISITVLYCVSTSLSVWEADSKWGLTCWAFGQPRVRNFFFLKEIPGRSQATFFLSLTSWFWYLRM